MKTIAIALILVYATMGAHAQGTLWFQQNPEPVDVIYKGVHFANPSTGMIAGSDGVILKTTDGGMTWNPQNSGVTTNLDAVQMLDENTAYVVGHEGVVLRTVNGGATWNKIPTGTAVTFLALDFFDANVGTIVGSSSTCLQTTNGGNNWTESDPGTGLNNVNDVEFVTQKRAYLVGNLGNIGISKNGGLTWQKQSSGVGKSLYGVSFSDTMYGVAVGEEGTILRTTNGGAKWIKQLGTIPLQANQLMDVQMFDSLTGVIVGTIGVILTTNDGGVNWEPQESPSNAANEALHFVTEKIGTIVGWTGAILRTETGGGLSVERLAAPVSEKPSLAACYPNPAVQSMGNPVIFEFSVPTTTGVSLTLYNALGMQVTRIFDEELTPGTYTASYSPVRLAPGLYFYRLQAAGVSLVKRLTVLK